MKTLQTAWMLAAMLLMPFAFAACGGSDDDDDSEPGINDVEGLHRLQETEDGLYRDNTLLYRITDKAKHEVEVVNAVSPETCQSVEIPIAVNINEKRYAVTAIADNAFSFYDEETNGYKKNKVLKKIIISHSVKRIGEYVCFYCTELQSMFVPKELAEIGEGAFACDDALEEIIVQEGNPVYDSRQDCNALIQTKENRLVLGCQTTVIPSGIKTIGIGAFRDTYGLTEIDIPASVTSIERSAFSGCYNLEKVISRNTTPPALGENALGNIHEECMLYVPDRSVDQYLSKWPFKPGYVKAIGTRPNR